MIDEVREATHALAKALKVIGLMNVQYAIKDGELFLIEGKSPCLPHRTLCQQSNWCTIAKLGARVMAGAKLKDLGFTEEILPNRWAIKESVFPFNKFPGSSIVLTPEMRSTGEVMGQDKDFGMAFAKTQMAANHPFPWKEMCFSA